MDIKQRLKNFNLDKTTLIKGGAATILGVSVLAIILSPNRFINRYDENVSLSVYNPANGSGAEQEDQVNNNAFSQGEPIIVEFDFKEYGENETLLLQVFKDEDELVLEVEVAPKEDMQFASLPQDFETGKYEVVILRGEDVVQRSEFSIE